jgi:hypothetical protein
MNIIKKKLSIKKITKDSKFIKKEVAKEVA